MFSESLSEDSSEKMVTDGVNVVSVWIGGVSGGAGGTRMQTEEWRDICK